MSVIIMCPSLNITKVKLEMDYTGKEDRYKTGKSK